MAKEESQTKQAVPPENQPEPSLHTAITIVKRAIKKA